MRIWSRLVAVLVLGVVATLHGARAARAVMGSPFDLTGHWAGYAAETDGKGSGTGTPETLEGDLSMVTTKGFTGTLAAAGDLVGQCTVTGREKKNLKLKLRLVCPGITLKVHGTLDVATVTIMGNYTRKGRRKLHHGTVTLTRQIG